MNVVVEQIDSIRQQFSKVFAEFRSTQARVSRKNSPNSEEEIATKN